MLVELNFNENFNPLYGDYIYIPKDIIFWRGFNPKYPAISDRPAYYGDIHFAQGYAEKYKTTALPFVTTKPIRLFDIRFMKVLLSQLFENNIITESDKDVISSTIISFGICSLNHQIELIKKRFGSFISYIKDNLENLEKSVKVKTIVEQQGVRIAETSNDAFIMGFLKELFHGVVDGFISPSMMSPFHIEKEGFVMNSELIIFNPLFSGIQLLPLPTSEKIYSTNIDILIKRQNRIPLTISTSTMEYSFYLPNSKLIKGGNKDIYMDDFNNLIDTGNKTIIKYYNDGIKQGKEWKKKTVKLNYIIQPGPEIPINIFK